MSSLRLRLAGRAGSPSVEEDEEEEEEEELRLADCCFPASSSEEEAELRARRTKAAG